MSMPTGNSPTHSPSTSAPPAIAASDLGRRFQRHWALAYLDLEVAPGEAVLLAGPNGSGKTTLLRVLAGLYQPTRGNLRLFGRDAARDRQACRAELSLVSHDSYLYPRLSALEMARIWARLLKVPSHDDNLLERLAEVGLDGRRTTPIGGFSAGMKKRMALLRSRLESPRLVLFDEPFSALDDAGQRLVEEWIQAFRREGATVLLASHALERSARLCDRAVLLDRGQLAWQGPPGQALEELRRLHG